MAKLSKTLWFEILARDGFRCRYCGASTPQAVLHVDHVLSRAKGGSDEPSNLAAACEDCNHGKSDRTLIASGEGFALTKDNGPARARKARAANVVPIANPNRHVLNTGEIDSLDEIDDDCQLALVWCDTHRKFEWHNIPRDMIGHTAELVRITRPGWRGAI